MKKSLGFLALAASVSFAEDAYLQSSGVQYVNLGYYMNPKSRIEVDFQYPTPPERNILFGAWDAGAKLCTAFWNDGGRRHYGIRRRLCSVQRGERGVPAVLLLARRGREHVHSGRHHFAQPVAGATNAMLTADWRRRTKTENYAVKAIFDCYGKPVERMSTAATVTCKPRGMTFICR